MVWTIAQAKSAGLTGKDVWKQYPRAMLRARVISEGIRTVYPGVSVGVYTVEEVQDFDSKPETKEVAAEVAPAAMIQPKADPKAELFAKLKTSKWSKEQMAEYSEKTFGVGTASKLTTDQLAALVEVACAEPAPAQDDSAEWEETL